MVKKFFILISIGIFLLPSGHGKDFSLLESSNFSKQRKEWTVLIFMSADNDLSSYAEYDIKEMESVIAGQQNLGASTDKVNVIVEADFAAHNGSFRYYIKQFKDSNLDESIRSPVVAHYKEDYLAVKDRFHSFVKWGKENYPAEKYFIILWGHGEGYGGVAFDNSDQTSMTIKDVKQSLSNGEKADILAFDACLMQSLEVVSEVKDSAQFVLGSNQIQNYLGLPYRVILDQLQGKSSAFSVAKNLPQWTEDSWKKDGHQGIEDPSAYETFTMSSVITAELSSSIYDHLERVSELLLLYLEERSSRLFDVKNRLERVPHFPGGSMDLGLFYGVMEELLYDEYAYAEGTLLSQELLAATRYARDEMRRSVFEQRFGPLYFSGVSLDEYMLGHFSGLSIWLPQSSDEYWSKLSQYEESYIYQELTQWPMVLDKLYSLSIVNFFGLD